MQVVGGIPVWVEDDDLVRGGDVKSDATRFGGDQKYELVWVIVEVIDCLCALLKWHLPVEVANVVFRFPEEGVEDVEEVEGVAEDENLISILVPEL